ncbi:MAG: BrnT family toxin [Phormidesmis sp.]
MEFEFDEKKRAANLEKHKIDFIEAQRIWADPNRLEIPARTDGSEFRFVVIGQVSGKVWSAVITYRGSAVRIISVRHTKKNELAAYEGEND